MNGGIWRSMLFTGTFFRSIDQQRRVAIPKSLREAINWPKQTVIYIAPGTDGSLALYTEDAFDQVAQLLGHSSPTAEDVRTFSRLFFGRAQRVEIDRQGRVRIPSELADVARLDKEAVLLGVRDHLELWDRNKWEQYHEEKQVRYDEFAERAFNNGSI